jgi:hypothetical protein
MVCAGDSPDCPRGRYPLLRSTDADNRITRVTLPMPCICRHTCVSGVARWDEARQRGGLSCSASSTHSVVEGLFFFFFGQCLSDVISTQVVNVWDPLYWGGADTVQNFSSRGFDVVLSLPDYLYADMPNEFNPEERGYYWASRSTSLKRVFDFSPENLPMNAETSAGARDGAPMALSSTSQEPRVS